MMKSKNTQKIKNLTFLALLTAIVVVLQLMGSFIHLGMFSVSLVLVPIVLGSALLGPLAGAWLGFVFGMTVLLSGDAAAFLTITFIPTVLVVLLKGALAGLICGLVYRLLEKKSKYLGVISSAVVCPVINSAVFVLGCFLFFLPEIEKWAAADGRNAVAYIFLVLVGGNFIFELVVNIVLAPMILKLVSIGTKIKEDSSYKNHI